jgi:hypothetical protein
MALVTAGAANAGGPDFRLSVSLGGCGPVICPPAPCRPVVRYRKETVCETVPRTEVWYDSCGHRHTRVVYEKVYRTVWVPIEECRTGTTVVIRDGHHHDDWRDRRWDDKDRHAHGGQGWDKDNRGEHRGWEGRGDHDNRGDRRQASDDRGQRDNGRDFGDRVAPARYASGGAAAQHSAPARAEQSAPARQVAAGHNDAARRVEAEQKVRALQNAHKGRLIPAAAAEKAPKREGLIALGDEVMARRAGKK